jgi:hypothetical protein
VVPYVLIASMNVPLMAFDAFFSAKLYLRILRPEWPALLPPDDQLPRPLRAALDNLHAEIRKIHEEAVLAA